MLVGTFVAFDTGARDPLRLDPGEPDDGLIRSLVLDRTSKSPEAITKLGYNSSELAAEHLLSLAEDSTLRDEGIRRLALVTALDRHSHGPHRERVVRRLIELFVPEPRSHSLGRAMSEEEPTVGLLPRARGATAFALARTKHPLALRLLISRAAEGRSVDPTGASFARDALRIVPRALLEREATKVLIGPRLLRAALGDAAVERLALSSPEDLAKLAPSGSEDGAGFDAWNEAVLRLVQTPTWPARFQSPQHWQKAWSKAPTWTLRALACASSRLDDRLLELTEQLSKRSVHVDDPIERSAAAWTLAVIAPDQAEPLLARRDPVIAAAILRQASRGSLAVSASRLVEEERWPNGKGDATWTNLRHVARHTSSWEPRVWERRSTRQLWTTPDEGPSFAHFAGLSSRISPRSQGAAPSVATVDEWLSADEPEQRSSVALGLGHSSVSSAAGLLLRAYRREPDPMVRRAIMASLSRHPTFGSRRLQETAALDPDWGVRFRAGLSSPSRDPGFVAMHSRRSIVRVLDREGRVLLAIPDPDGFVAIRGDSL